MDDNNYESERDDPRDDEARELEEEDIERVDDIEAPRGRYVVSKEERAEFIKELFKNYKLTVCAFRAIVVSVARNTQSNYLWKN